MFYKNLITTTYRQENGYRYRYPNGNNHKKCSASTVHEKQEDLDKLAHLSAI